LDGLKNHYKKDTIFIFKLMTIDIFGDTYRINAELTATRRHPQPIPHIQSYVPILSVVDRTVEPHPSQPARHPPFPDPPFPGPQSRNGSSSLMAVHQRRLRQLRLIRAMANIFASFHTCRQEAFGPSFHP